MWVTTKLTIAPEWEPLLRRHGLDTVEGIYSYSLGMVVAGSGTTETRRVELADGSQARSFFIKKYWYPSFGRRIRAVGRGTLVGRPKVRREYENLLQLRAWNLDAPKPAAWGVERSVGWLARSFLITESVPDPMPLHVYLSHVLPSFPFPTRARKRRELIRNLARYTRRLHEHRFAHQDLFWRNIILSGQSLDHFFLIDAHKSHHWKAGQELKAPAADLACLDAAAPWFFHRSERLRFYLIYSGQSRLNGNDKRFLRRVLAMAEPMRPKQLRRALNRPGPSLNVPGLLRPATGSNTQTP